MSPSELDESRSIASEHYLLNRREQRLKPCEVVTVEIGIWPIGIIWHAGQKTRLAVQGNASRWMEDKLFTEGPVFGMMFTIKGTTLFMQTGNMIHTFLC